MTAKTWVEVGDGTARTGPLGATIVDLVTGTDAMVIGTGNDLTADKGRVVKTGSGLVVEMQNGQRVPLTSANVGNFKFHVPVAKLEALGSSADPAAKTHDERMLAIVAKVPGWARVSVTRALLPERFAAWEKTQKAQAEKAKAARISQLSELGRLVSGKRPERADAPGGGKQPAKSEGKPAQTRAEREAQLRRIGAAVSR